VALTVSSTRTAAVLPSMRRVASFIVVRLLWM
jgi:hypothetical protein